MELQGRIIAVLEAREGTSARGPWKSQEYVIETHDQYPKKMVFNIFGADRIAQFAIKAGEELLVSFDIDAHEYQGRWFNNIRAWNVQRVEVPGVATAPTSPVPPPPLAATAGAPDPFAPGAADEDKTDDLPF
ncbi:MAG: DUF3127 domain-containing protein [Prevotella sp.]|nr:DUF3127 domain-containing protein [Prevotella sp.]MDD7273398.1 DUF3127 domain-containing protein [Prevotellaceae bacterium]MDY3935848.1 DUF3127 domain-containing protein [Prevotella sp.]MDY4217768.1 DUF3127 domain-containing protein [Prevotella sp.]